MQVHEGIITSYRRATTIHNRFATAGGCLARFGIWLGLGFMLTTYAGMQSWTDMLRVLKPKPCFSEHDLR